MVPCHPAGLVSRLAALTLDVVLVTAMALGVGSLPGLAWEQMVGRVPGWLSTACTIGASVVAPVYFTFGWWLTGQTVGDMVLGLVVRRHDGGPVSFPRAALRAVIGLLLPPLWLLGMLAVLWNDQRRAWHDRRFGTIVCYAPSNHAPSNHVPPKNGAVTQPR